METAVWRALAVFRGLCLCYAIVLFALRSDEYRHPVGGWLVLAAMAVWTVVITAVYRVPSGRRWSVLTLDLAVAMAAVISSRYLDDPERIAADLQQIAGEIGQVDTASPEFSVLKDRLGLLAARTQWVTNAQQRNQLEKLTNELWNSVGAKR